MDFSRLQAERGRIFGITRISGIQPHFLACLMTGSVRLWMWPFLNFPPGKVSWARTSYRAVCAFGTGVECRGDIFRRDLWRKKGRIPRFVPSSCTSFTRPLHTHDQWWLLGLAFVLATMGSIVAILLDEISFGAYKFSQVGRLFLAAIIGNFGYRQLVTWANFMGLMAWLFQCPYGETRKYPGLFMKAWTPKRATGSDR